ncbi:MAG: hypothetical protein F6K19_44825 [Cyanothece sp. SIO1E1]|nr:hypothetical protein [Cyanothece sp. SIO1E1]
MKFRFIFWLSLLLTVWLLCSGGVNAGPLVDRLAKFPDWRGKPSVQVPRGDLVYPDWLAGTWDVTTTLVDLAAPLAPKVTSPGFESNQQFLNQPVVFQARFIENPLVNSATGPTNLTQLMGQTFVNQPAQIVADRAFNGLNLAKTYLGDEAILSVEVASNSPNRQLTTLRSNQQLISTVTGRATETPNADEFIATEVCQQVFNSNPRPYINAVETTTRYHRLQTTNPAIEADQVTAIYLSPQDPDYFKAGNRPVALYRYRLEFAPL